MRGAQCAPQSLRRIPGRPPPFRSGGCGSPGPCRPAGGLAIGEMALRGLDAVRLRAFNHTGPGQSEDFVVASFARQIARVEQGLQAPELRVGALDRWRDFLDVRDVCIAYAAALRGPAGDAAACEPGLVLNLASGASRRIGDILDGLLSL